MTEIKCIMSEGRSSTETFLLLLTLLKASSAVRRYQDPLSCASKLSQTSWDAITWIATSPSRSSASRQSRQSFTE
ncbi:hypothetical protein EDC01DRAFT_641774 [Geopyxis carbonaria]|nr:hypothetical protein EDC01DRAFT_641774 [Geopyxis carbonaria]